MKVSQHEWEVQYDWIGVVRGLFFGGMFSPAKASVFNPKAAAARPVVLRNDLLSIITILYA